MLGSVEEISFVNLKDAFLALLTYLAVHSGKGHLPKNTPKDTDNVVHILANHYRNINHF